MLTIFSRVCWPSTCLLWRNVYLVLLPIFLIGLFHSLILSYISCLYILDIYDFQNKIMHTPPASVLPITTSTMLWETPSWDVNKRRITYVKMEMDLTLVLRAIHKWVLGRSLEVILRVSWPVMSSQGRRRFVGRKYAD